MWRYWLLRVVSIPLTLISFSFLLFVVQNWSGHYSEHKISSLIVQEQVLLSAYEADELIRKERKKYALDKPIFYFSIRSKNIPIEIDAIYPASHQNFVKKIAWQYGAQPETVIALYEALLHHTKFHPNVYTKLWDCSSIACIKEYIPNPEDSLKNILHTVEVNKSPWKALLPTLSFQSDCQFHFWLINLVRHSGGQTMTTKANPISLIQNALKYTFLLTIPAFLITWLGGFILAIYLMEVQPKVKRTLFGILYLLDGIPLFWLGLLLLTFFSSNTVFLWFPSVGLDYRSVTFIEAIPYITLPIIAMTLTAIPYTTRQVHEAIVEVKTKAFVTAAILKGINKYRLYMKHILPNAAITLATVISEFLLAVVAGSLVVEIIFNIPGFGRLLTTSVLSRDFPVVALMLLFLLGLKMLLTLITDILYRITTPVLRT